MPKLLPKRTNLHLVIRRPDLLLRVYWPLLAVLCAAALADGWTTLRDVELYGAGIEAHPVQRIFFILLGPMWGVPVAKMIQIAFVLLVALWWRPWTRWVLGACTLLYALAAVNNYFLIL